MKKKICAILIAVLVAVLGASTYFIIEHYKEANKQAELYDDLADLVEAAVQTDTVDSQARINVLPDLSNGLHQLGHSLCRKILRLHGNDYAICRRQRIQSDHTERRHTINQYIVIIVFDLAQIASQNGFTAHCGDKHHFHSGQLDVGREQIDIFLVMQNTALRVCMILTDNPGELVGNGRRKTVIISPSEASREVALWVGIYKEYLLAESCKSNTQIDRCGRFACSAFLIADSNGFTVWHFAFPPSY